MTRLYSFIWKNNILQVGCEAQLDVKLLEVMFEKSQLHLYQRWAGHWNNRANCTARPFQLGLWCIGWRYERAVARMGFTFFSTVLFWLGWALAQLTNFLITPKSQIQSVLVPECTATKKNLLHKCNETTLKRKIRQTYFLFNCTTLLVNNIELLFYVPLTNVGS